MVSALTCHLSHPSPEGEHKQAPVMKTLGKGEAKKNPLKDLV